MSKTKYRVIAWLYLKEPGYETVYAEMADFIAVDGDRDKAEDLTSQISDGVMEQVDRFKSRMNRPKMVLTHTDTVLCERIEEDR